MMYCQRKTKVIVVLTLLTARGGTSGAGTLFFLFGGGGGGQALFVINGCPTKALFTRSVPAPLGGTTGVGALYDLAICCCSACQLRVWLCTMMIPQLHYDNLDTIFFLERKKCVGVPSPLTKHPGVSRGWGWRWSAPLSYYLANFGYLLVSSDIGHVWSW